MRLFVGVFPPTAAVADLTVALAAVRDGCGLRRWLPTDRWHVTLAFLGDVEPQHVDEIRAALAAGCRSPGPAPRLRLAGSGSFATGRGAGALWIGVLGEGLTELATRVRDVVPNEARPFQGHLTVARWRPPEQPDDGLLAALRSYCGPEWDAEKVALVRSHLGQQPRYERLDAWPLPYQA